MDPPPSTTTPPPPQKLRLMCSYGGKIISRPNSITKSLYYAGGDTRIITIPTNSSSLTLSYLINHLSLSLNITNPFSLKYQLPSHDLDSLISLSNDDDLVIMLEEYHRLSPTPSRIRLFLFQSVSELKHPKTETWFADVLKSAKILQKGVGGGFDSDGNNSENCGAESLVLETSSSFGSTSSSVSSTNLPSKGSNFVDDVTSKLPATASDSFAASDNSVGVSTTTAVSFLPAGTYQEQVTYVPVTENKACYPIESEGKMINTSTVVEMNRPVHVSGFPVSLQFDQPLVQYVQTAAPQYVAQNASAMMPVPSYYVMSSPMPQQQTYYQTNLPAPVYFVPVGHPYNVPMQSGFVNPANVAASHPPAHPNYPPNPAQISYKVAATSPVPEVASQVYRTPPMPSSLINLPRSESPQPAGGLPPINQQPQSIGVTSMENVNYTTEPDDDPVRVQIYKSQPPAPTLPSQYTTMTKTTAVMLSEALAQLQTDSSKQQIRTGQPQ